MIRREFIHTAVLILVLLLATVLGAYAADDYYVKTTGDNSNTGETLSEAWQTITYALGNAVAGATIHVAAGTYVPSTTAPVETFPLSIGSAHNDMQLLGAGMGMTILDGQGTKGSPTTRVMNIEGVSNFTLEGFTITGGAVTYDGGYSGGSAYGDYLSVGNGGGIYCYESTDVKIIKCEISNNYAKGTWAARHGRGSNINWNCVWGSDNSCIPGRAGGGGIYLRFCKDTSTKKATVTIEECLIHDNETGMGGGGICSNYAPPEVRHTSIYNNKACQGGGVYWFDYIRGDLNADEIIPHILFNDLIFGNTIREPRYYGCEEDACGNDPWTDDQGGGVYLSSWGLEQTFELYSTTIADNDGYEVWISHQCTNPNVNGANNIFWPDDDQKGFEDDGFNGTCSIHHSDIWYGDGSSAYPGTGNNIVKNPNFQTRSSVITEKYFLDQTLTKPNGPVDAGDDTAYDASILIGGGYSTDKRDSATYQDTSVIDMGYHYGYHSMSYVQLLSFTASSSGDDIVLSWETGVEIDNAGFVIYRSEAGVQDYRCISGLVPAQGSAVSGASYAFVDEDVMQGVSLEYWLVDIDTSGNWTAHGPAFTRRPVILRPENLRVQEVAIR